MVGLTPTQKKDLNFAIQQYLMKEKYDKAAEAFAVEAQVDYDGYLKTAN